MASATAGFEPQTVADPSRLCPMSNQTSTTVGPTAWSTSAAVCTPSPFESRYMYWADAGEESARRTRAMLPRPHGSDFMEDLPPSGCPALAPEAFEDARLRSASIRLSPATRIAGGGGLLEL